MKDIASRATWRARYRDGDGTTLTTLATMVSIHHTVTTANAQNIDAEKAHMRLLEQIGQQSFRAGISYNIVVFPSGRAYHGVTMNRRGTHTAGHNSVARSIAFAGNFERDQPTAQALETARAIIAYGRGRWWARDAPVLGHGQFPGNATACPGRHLAARMTELATPPALPTPATTHERNDHDMRPLIEAAFRTRLGRNPSLAEVDNWLLKCAAHPSRDGHWILTNITNSQEGKRFAALTQAERDRRITAARNSAR